MGSSSANGEHHAKDQQGPNRRHVHDTLGNTGKKTGFYFDEMSGPYWAMMDAGYAVEIASIKGGKAPYDAGSYGEPGKRPCRRAALH